MRSTSGEQWEVRRVMPTELCRVSLYGVFFYGTLAAGLLFFGLGVLLAVRQQFAGPVGEVKIAPYVVILASTGACIVFASIVWAAAGKPVTAWDPDTEYLQSLAPLHMQKWTYQENQCKGIMATLVAVIWHVVGLLSLGHYCYVASPIPAVDIWVFGLFEVIGVIPMVLAIKGWKQRGKGGGTLRPSA